MKDHSDLVFMPRKKMIKSKKFISFTIWMILIISFFISIYYWWILSGFSDALKDPSTPWFTLLLLLMTVGTGAATELVKTVSLGHARNFKLWIYATIVSIVTVMGTYAILDQDRKNKLQAGSVSHESDVKNKDKNDAVIAQYRHAASYDIKKLEADAATNVEEYGKKGNDYPKYKYLEIKKDLDKKIKDYYTYKGAVDASKGLESKVNQGGGDVVTNPLLDNVAKLVANGKTNIVVLGFYLAVTVLLEWAAYTLGGRVEAIEIHLQNVEAHIADLTNLRVFGFTMKQVQRDMAIDAIGAQRERLVYEREMRRAMLEQTDENGKKLSLEETSDYVNGLKNKLNGNNDSSNNKDSDNSNNTIDFEDQASIQPSVLDGLTVAELEERHSRAVANKGKTGRCITCDAEFNRTNRSLYCSHDHSREYQKVLKRAKRSEGMA